MKINPHRILDLVFWAFSAEEKVAYFRLFDYATDLMVLTTAQCSYRSYMKGTDMVSGIYIKAIAGFIE